MISHSIRKRGRRVQVHFREDKTRTRANQNIPYSDVVCDRVERFLQQVSDEVNNTVLGSVPKVLDWRRCSISLNGLP